MKLIDIVKDDTLKKLLVKYSFSEKGVVNQQLKSWEDILNSNKFILPVLGVQGAGKSSLLNSLLMDDIVLPVDSDETTCIPTEIVYSNQDKNDAEILFLDGHTEFTPCSEAGLKPYVHQEDNEENKKGVQCIKVYKNTPLLENGVVLVDLPGVGSLTSNNIKTTMDYLKQSAGALFLLRTIPPITNSESIFIKTAWPLLGKVFFVQNQWNDETIEEVNDGKEHSLLVLNEIANKSKLSNFDVVINIVNVYKALTAKVNQDIESLENSGLNNLKVEIENFVKTWKTTIIFGIKGNLQNQIISADSVTTKEIESLQQKSSVLEKEYIKERELFEEELTISKKKYREIRNEIDDNQYKLGTETNKAIKREKENFRNEMRTAISKGITDGSKLEQVFKDIRNERTDDIFKEIDPLFEDFVENIRRHLEEIPEFSFNKTKKNYSAGIDDKIHFEELLGKGGKAGGMFGGMAIGAKVGAAVGGPWGMAIGVIVGGAFGMLGGFLGGKLGAIPKKAIMKSRVKEAKTKVFSIIDKWSNDLNDNLQKQLTQMINKMNIVINSWFNESEAEFNKREKILKNNLKKSDNKKQVELEKIIKDKNTLSKYLNLLKG